MANNKIDKGTKRPIAMVATVAAMALLGVAGSQPARAQAPDPVAIDVSDCVELESDAERLACFEAQVDAARSSDAAGQSAAPAPATEPPPDETARERRARLRAERQGRGDEFREGEIVGKIAEVQERQPNTYVITLENGQIWQQVTPRRYPLRAGLDVRIYPTNWGESYRLSLVDFGGYIQVKRVR